MKKQLGFIHNESGFSLLDLIAVLLVLAVLALIALPAILDNKSDNNEPDKTAFVQQAKMDYCTHGGTTLNVTCSRSRFGRNKLEAYCIEEVFSPRREKACERAARVWAYPFARFGGIEEKLVSTCLSPKGADFYLLLEDEITAYRKAVIRRIDAGFTKPGVLPLDGLKSPCKLENGGTQAVIQLK